MKDYLANEVRNVVVLGHSGAGKSSVIESCLAFTKAIDRYGKANDGTTFLNFDAEEGKRGLSVYCHLAPVEWKNRKINFIDTPGYMDYEGEEITGLTVGDNALIVVDAKEGIEAGTERAWKEAAAKRKLPTIFFINKMDDPNASFEKTYQELHDKFGKRRQFLNGRNDPVMPRGSVRRKRVSNAEIWTECFSRDLSDMNRPIHMPSRHSWYE